MGKCDAIEVRLNPHSDAEQGAARLARALEQMPAGARLVRFVQPIPALDALGWLSSRPDDLRIHWQDRDGAFRLAGVGSAAWHGGASAQDALRLLREAATGEVFDSLRVLAWGRPDPRTIAGPQWAALGDVQAVLPLVEYREEKEHASFCVNLWRPEHDPEGKALGAQMRRAQQLLAAPMGRIANYPLAWRRQEESPDSTTFHLRATQGSAVARARGARRFVLPRTRRYELPGAMDPLSLLRLTAARREPTFRVMVQVARQHALVVLGSSLLYRRRSDAVIAEVTTGAALRGKTLKEDARRGDTLLESAPHVLEHESLRLELQARLGRVCLKMQAGTGPRIVPERGLLRLRSAVLGDLEPGTGDGPLMALLHPGASGCGFPSDASLPLTSGLEGMDLGLLGGFVGCFGRRETEVAEIVPALLQAGSRVQVSTACGIGDGIVPAIAWADSAALLHALEADLSLEADLGLAACDPSAMNPTSTASGAG